MRFKQNCLTDNTIQLYSDNELPENERIMVEQHLEQCPGCSLKVQKHTEWINHFKLAMGKPSGINTGIPDLRTTNTLMTKNFVMPLLKIAAAIILILGGYFIVQYNNIKTYQPTASDLLLWEETVSGDDANYKWHNRNVSILFLNKEGIINYMDIN